MTTKRRAPSLDPETGKPVDAVSPVPPTTPVPPGGDGASAVAPSSPGESPSLDGDVWKERHLRLAAEYDNFRKRTMKERAETWTRAQADLVKRLVDALDDLSRFAHISPADTDAKTLHEGVELVERKVWKELEGVGVSRIDEMGVLFNPNIHEALTMQPATDPSQDHTVGQVIQPGYKIGDALLRPARVVVLTWQDK